jgi:hypothetical protein
LLTEAEGFSPPAVKQLAREESRTSQKRINYSLILLDYWISRLSSVHY